MPSFSTILRSASRYEWKEHYIPYSELKEVLEKFAQRRSNFHNATIAARAFNKGNGKGICARARSSCSRTVASTSTMDQDEDQDQTDASQSGILIERYYDLESTRPDASGDADYKNPYPYQCSSAHNKKPSKQNQERYLAFLEQEELCHVLDECLDTVEDLYWEQIHLLEGRVNEWIACLKRDQENKDRSLYGFDQTDNGDVDVDTGGRSPSPSPSPSPSAAESGSIDQSLDSYSIMDSTIDTYDTDAMLVDESHYRQLGQDILELYAFVGTNSIALRQILIRYDCLIRTLNGPPVGPWYITQRRNQSRQAQQQQLYERTFRRMRNLTTSFEAVFTRRQLILLANKYTIHILPEDENYAHLFHLQTSQMEHHIQNAQLAMDGTMNGPWAIEDSLMHTLQYYFLAGSLSVDLMMVPSFIRTRGATLKSDLRYFQEWRETQLVVAVVEEGMDVDDLMIGLRANANRASAHAHESKRLKDVLTPSLILNFTAQLLYMMNHYIIEPSSTQYIRELGGNVALSGMLIGVTPWAALISAFAYSHWSNKSFKAPLLCASLFLTIGSFVYANALKFNSIPLAMIGRCLTGLGAPCGLNIRIIADTVSSRHRTAISAIFVTVSAMGMSLGPGIAVLLDYIYVEVHLPIFGDFIINGLTGPGYLMSLIWFVYTICLVLKFEDEERIGIQEIAERTKSVEAYHPPPPVSCSSGGNVSPTSSTKSVATEFGADDGMYDDRDRDRDGGEEEPPSALINDATLVCMTLKFIGKFVVEILGCSVSLITMHRYQWSVKNIGSLSFVNGCLIIPISTGVGYLSQYYSDRTLLVGLLCMALTGVLLLIDVDDFMGGDGHNGYHYAYYEENLDDNEGWSITTVGPKRYIVGIVLEFCGLQAAQSVTLVSIVPCIYSMAEQK